jgi:hypothetical protein
MGLQLATAAPSNICAGLEAVNCFKSTGLCDFSLPSAAQKGRPFCTLFMQL